MEVEAVQSCRSNHACQKHHAQPSVRRNRARHRGNRIWESE